MKPGRAPVISCLTSAALLMSMFAGLMFTCGTGAQTPESRSARTDARAIIAKAHVEWSFNAAEAVGDDVALVVEPTDGIIVGDGAVLIDGIILGDHGIIVGDATVQATANRSMMNGG